MDSVLLRLSSLITMQLQSYDMLHVAMCCSDGDCGLQLWCVTVIFVQRQCCE